MRLIRSPAECHLRRAARRTFGFCAFRFRPDGASSTRPLALLKIAASVGISNKKLLRTASKQIIGSSAAALPFASHGVMKMLTLMVIPIVYDDYYDGISLSFQFQIQVCSSVVLGNLIKYTHYTEVFKTSSASPL